MRNHGLFSAIGRALSNGYASRANSGATFNPARKRREAKHAAGAERRAAQAAEIAEWNSKVVRRNRAFVLTGQNKHQRSTSKR